MARIRLLRTAKDYIAAEELQKKIWRFPEREIIPLNELTVLQKHGGCIFGAFESGRLVSFCYSQPAFDGKKVYHYSRILGVLPRYRNRGLGMKMKLKQREYVLKQGVDLIRWTFDPLQTRNGALNLAKLGAIVREYITDLYPSSASAFNRGVGSDRFVAEWWLNSKHVKDSLAGRRRVIKADRIVEVPSDIDRIKEKSVRKAREWRRTTRKVFRNLIKHGYVVYDLSSRMEKGTRRSFYHLAKGLRIR